MAGVKGETVGDDGITVTQVGYIRFDMRGHWSAMRVEFRCAPRPHKAESTMSVLEGRMGVNEALMRVSGGYEGAGSADAVRYATIGDLRKVGFEVKYDQSKRIPEHLSVSYADEWDEAARIRFSESFREYARAPVE